MKQARPIQKPVGTIATNALVIPLESIGADPDQPRKEFDEDALLMLAESLVDHGQLQPIRVRKAPEGRDGFVIVCGERRWRAALLAGLPTLTAIVQDVPLADDEIRVLQLIENCCREDLPPLDQARAMRSLMEIRGWKQDRLAREVGVSSSTVSRSLALLDMPETLRDLVASGELSAAVARELDRLDDKDLVRKLATDAIKWNWTRSQAIAAARARGAPLPDDALQAAQPASVPVGDPPDGPETEVRIPTELHGAISKEFGEDDFDPDEGGEGGAIEAPEDDPEGDDDQADDDETLESLPARFLVKNSKGGSLYCLTAPSLAEAEAWAVSQHPADWGGSVVPISEAYWRCLPKWILTKPSGKVEARASYQVAPGVSIVKSPSPAPGEGRDVPGRSFADPKVSGLDSGPEPKPDPKVPPGKGWTQQLVFGFVSETGFEIVIERSTPWTGQEILVAVWELKTKLERQYLHGEGGGR